MPRIVMISKALVVGAYQRKLEELAAQPDIELIAIVPPSWRQDGRRLELERAHTAGYSLIVAPLLLNGNYHAHCYPTLARLLRDARPDLVHVDEEPYNLATWQAVRIAQRIGARSLFFGWQNLQRRYPSPFRQMEAWVLAHVSGALVGNQAAASVLHAKGYAGPLRVLPQFGVDPDLYRPAPTAPPPDAPFSIGYAGRLVPEKGVDTLLEAAAGLSGAWRLQIYGSGPARDALRQQTIALGISDRTRFYDQVPSSEMPAHLAGLDALALPSRTRPNWMEQFGRVLIEAMACGVPVIGSSSGEIPNVIGEAGLIFAEGDALALRRHLARLQADAALRRTLATAGRARVLAQYTQAQIAAETADFYRELCAQPAPPRRRG